MVAEVDWRLVGREPVYVERPRGGGGCEIMWGEVRRLAETGSWLEVRRQPREQGYYVV